MRFGTDRLQKVSASRNIKKVTNNKKQFMAAGNQVGKIFIWDLWSGYQNKPHHTLTHAKMLSQCRQCSFSPNGDVLIAVYDDSTVWRFDYRNYARKREVNGASSLSQTPYELNGRDEPKIEAEIKEEPVEAVDEPEIKMPKLDEVAVLPTATVITAATTNGDDCS